MIVLVNIIQKLNKQFRNFFLALKKGGRARYIKVTAGGLFLESTIHLYYPFPGHGPLYISLHKHLYKRKGATCFKFSSGSNNKND